MFARRTIGFALTLAAFSAAQAEDSLLKFIKTMDAKTTPLMMKKDLKGWKKVIAPMVTKDFKYTEEGRTYNLDSMVKSMEQGFAGMQKINKVESKVLKHKVKGAVATVESSHTIVAAVAGEKGKPAELKMIGLSIDTYVKDKKGWMLKAMDWKSTQYFMNGKQFNPSAAQQ